jgi:hypothetical protein
LLQNVLVNFLGSMALYHRYYETIEQARVQLESIIRLVTDSRAITVGTDKFKPYVIVEWTIKKYNV